MPELGQSLADLYPAVAAEWHSSKNDRSASEFYPGSHAKVWWVCRKGHEWQTVIKNRSRGSGCPVCSNKRVLAGVNDLATVRPDLAAEWHPSKNGDLASSDVTHSSMRKVWWQCHLGHEWQATVNNRERGRGCGVCGGRRVLAGFNDLATVEPVIASEWHPTRNGSLSPEDVLPGSNKRVWWKCDLGSDHEWEATISNRTTPSVRSGCAVCAGRVVVKSNSLAGLFPEVRGSGIQLVMVAVT